MNNWKTLKLGEILKVKSGHDQKAIECEGGKYQILGTGGEIGRTNTFLYDKPSVLIGRKGTINKPMYRDEPFWTVDTLFYTEIKEGFSPKYIYYLFKTINWLKYNEASGVPSLTSSTIETIKVKVPDLDTQQKIVQFLDQIENMIESLTSRIEKEELTKSAIAKKVFSQITEKNHQNTQLGDISEIYQPKTLSPKEIKQGNYPVFGANGVIGFHNQYNHEKSQVAISCRGANCGKVNYIPEKCWITGNSMVVNTDSKNNIDKLFLYYYLSNLNLSCLISGSGIPQITRAAAQKYKIALPDIKKQKEISSLLKTQSDLILNLREIKQQYRQVRKFLLKHLISGDFDLTNIKLEKERSNDD